MLLKAISHPKYVPPKSASGDDISFVSIRQNLTEKNSVYNSFQEFRNDLSTLYESISNFVKPEHIDGADYEPIFESLSIESNIVGAVQRLSASLDRFSESTLASQASDDWVLCSKCEKWRRLPPGMSAAGFPDNWTCENITWDPTLASCSVPQEPSNDDDNNKDEAGAKRERKKAPQDPTKKRAKKTGTATGKGSKLAQSYPVGTPEHKFYKGLEITWDATNISAASRKPIVFHGTTLPFFDFYRIVLKHGGFDAVNTKHGAWSVVGRELLALFSAPGAVQTADSQGAYRLRKSYERLLLEYERRRGHGWDGEGPCALYTIDEQGNPIPQTQKETFSPIEPVLVPSQEPVAPSPAKPTSAPALKDVAPKAYSIPTLISRPVSGQDTLSRHLQKTTAPVCKWGLGSSWGLSSVSPSITPQNLHAVLQEVDTKLLVGGPRRARLQYSSSSSIPFLPLPTTDHEIPNSQFPRTSLFAFPERVEQPKVSLTWVTPEALPALFDRTITQLSPVVHRPEPNKCLAATIGSVDTKAGKVPEKLGKYVKGTVSPTAPPQSVLAFSDGKLSLIPISATTETGSTTAAKDSVQHHPSGEMKEKGYDNQGSDASSHAGNVLLGKYYAEVIQSDKMSSVESIYQDVVWQAHTKNRVLSHLSYGVPIDYKFARRRVGGKGPIYHQRDCMSCAATRTIVLQTEKGTNMKGAGETKHIAQSETRYNSGNKDEMGDKKKNTSLLGGFAIPESKSVGEVDAKVREATINDDAEFSDLNSDTETETETESEADTETETESEMETETESEAEIDTESESASGRKSAKAIRMAQKKRGRPKGSKNRSSVLQLENIIPKKLKHGEVHSNVQSFESEAFIECLEGTWTPAPFGFEEKSVETECVASEGDLFTNQSSEKYVSSPANDNRRPFRAWALCSSCRNIKCFRCLFPTPESLGLAKNDDQSRKSLLSIAAFASITTGASSPTGSLRGISDTGVWTCDECVRYHSASHNDTDWCMTCSHSLENHPLHPYLIPGVQPPTDSALGICLMQRNRALIPQPNEWKDIVTCAGCGGRQHSTCSWRSGSISVKVKKSRTMFTDSPSSPEIENDALVFCKTCSVSYNLHPSVCNQPPSEIPNLSSLISVPTPTELDPLGSNATAQTALVNAPLLLQAKPKAIKFFGSGQSREIITLGSLYDD